MINIVKKGADRTGIVDCTDILSKAIEDDTSAVIYFPKGEYLISPCVFENKNDITLYLKGATLNLNSTVTDENYMFKLINCNNISFIGGTIKGNHLVATGIRAFNSQRLRVQSEIVGFGTPDSSYSAGIALMGDCSYSRLEKVYIHDIKTGPEVSPSAIDSDNYIHCVGIGCTKAGEKYSKYVTIDSPVINDIGDYEVTVEYSEDERETKMVDGDGIYIIQRPIIETISENNENKYILKDTSESHIKISNPYITNCSKRGIKVSTRAVEIEDGYIDVNSWNAAVEFQLSQNCSIKNAFIRNSRLSALAISWDNGNVTVDNCKIMGNMKNNIIADNKYSDYGIVLNGELSKDEKTFAYYTEENHNIKISNCEFDDVVSAVYTGTEEDKKKKRYSKITITDPYIGHFSGDSAIKLNNSRIEEIDCLDISGLNFKYGNTANNVFKANNLYYSANINNGQLVNIGSNTYFVDPKASVTIKSNCLYNNFKEIYQDYIFSARNVDFGEQPTDYDDVFEKAENLIYLSDGQYTSASNETLTAYISNNTITVNVGSMSNASDYIYIPLKSNIEFDNRELNYEINNITSVSPNITVTFTKADNRYSAINGGLETTLNGKFKRRVLNNIIGTAGYLRIKVSSGISDSFSTSFDMSVTDRKQIFKNNLELRITALEEKLLQIM